MAERIQFRRDIASEWVTYNPLLADGEIGIEKDTKRFKLGDGITYWNDLAYSSESLADNAKRYIEYLDVVDITYNTDGTVATEIFQYGHKAIYSYDLGLLSSISYTDTDGVSVLTTVTYTYIDGNLISITQA